MKYLNGLGGLALLLTTNASCPDVESVEDGTDGGSGDGGADTAEEASDAALAAYLAEDGRRGPALPASTIVVNSFDGQYCSTSIDENPYQRCAPGNRLVCISTYARAVPVDPGEPDAGPRAVYVCRLICDPAGAPCPVAGDVCCAGDAFDGTAARSHACVPPGQCAARP